MTLPSAVDLRRVAEWAGTPVQTIQELNPELRRWTTPLRATDYELKVPEGTAALVNARMLEVAADELAPLNRHTVKKGETLLSISKKLKVSRADLAEANYLSTKATSEDRPAVDHSARADAAARGENTRPLHRRWNTGDRIRPRRTRSRSRASAPARPAAVASRVAPEKVIHRVKRGDTLFSIAKRYDTTVRRAEGVEPAAKQRHPDRSAPDDLPRRRTRYELIVRGG